MKRFRVVLKTMISPFDFGVLFFVTWHRATVVCETFKCVIVCLVISVIFLSNKHAFSQPNTLFITRLSSRARCSKLYNLLCVLDPQRTRYFSSISALSEKSDPCSLRNHVSWQRSTHVFEGKRGATRCLIQQVVQVVVLGESVLIPVAVWQGIDGEDEEAVEQEVEEDPLWLLLVQLSLAGLCQNLAGHRVRW